MIIAAAFVAWFIGAAALAAVIGRAIRLGDMQCVCPDCDTSGF